MILTAKELRRVRRRVFAFVRRRWMYCAVACAIALLLVLGWPTSLLNTRGGLVASSQRIQLVLAACEEDLSWVSALTCDRYTITVYSKCGASEQTLGLSRPAAGTDGRLQSPSCITIVENANRGKESLAFLNFILDRYDDLPSLTMFAQAGPHSFKAPDFIEKLDHIDASRTGFLPLSEVACVAHYALWNNGLKDMRDNPLAKDAEPYAVLCGLYGLLAGRQCEAYTASYRGEFAVSRRRILRNSKRVYKQLHEFLSAETNLRSHRGKYVERLWAVLFDCAPPVSNHRALPICLDDDAGAQETLAARSSGSNGGKDLEKHSTFGKVSSELTGDSLGTRTTERDSSGMEEVDLDDLQSWLPSSEGGPDGEPLGFSKEKCGGNSRVLQAEEVFEHYLETLSQVKSS